MRRIVFCGLMVVVCVNTRAMFMPDQTEKVPVDRLISNIQQQLARNTNDFEKTYQLARLHAMAYAGAQQANVVTGATKRVFTPPGTSIVYAPPGSDTGIPREPPLPTTAKDWQAAREHITNAIVLYEHSTKLLKRATNTTEAKWLILPLKLGYSWCLEQAGRTNDALRNYRKTLKIAWQTEIEGKFEFKQWLEDTWDQIKARKFPSTRRHAYIGPGVCFTEETIGYMLKLLDPVKDAKEIAELKGLQSQLAKMGRAITPIVVPLADNADFCELVDPTANVSFDLDGSALPRKWGWITPKAAWLVFDQNGSGDITSGLQMFGNVSFWIFWRNGYAALISLDADGDGILKGAELNGLALWHDANSNGKSDSGEVQPLSHYGVESINCQSEPYPSGFPWQPRGITFSNGTVRPTFDWIVPSYENGPNR